MTRRGAIYFVAVGVLWGLPYSLIRITVRQLSPEFLVFARSALTTVVMVPFAWRQGGWIAVLRRWRVVLVYTLVELAVPWLMLFRAEQHLPSSLAGLLLATIPIFALLLAGFFAAKEHIGLTRWTGIAIGLGGVAVLVGLDVRANDVVAVLEVGLTAVGYALGPLIVSRYLRELPALVVITVSFAICTIAYIPAAVLSYPAHVSAETIESVLTLAIVCSVIGFIAFFALIAEVGPARATVVTYLNPAVAVLIGVIALHEPFTVGVAVGFPLVIAGSYFATRPQSERDHALADREQPTSVE